LAVEYRHLNGSLKHGISWFKHMNDISIRFKKKSGKKVDKEAIVIITYYWIMKIKLKQWWLTILPISMNYEIKYRLHSRMCSLQVGHCLFPFIKTQEHSSQQATCPVKNYHSFWSIHAQGLGASEILFYYIIQQGEELTCLHFFKWSC
jgi:hypothetical protein